MLIQAVFAATRQVLSPSLRRVLWKSLAVTAALLTLVWLGLSAQVRHFLPGHPSSTEYAILDGFGFFLAGAGLFIALAYFLPAVSAVVAGYFADDVAEVVERADFPAEPPGRALPLGRALLYGVRFAGLSLLVNVLALILFFVPGLNVAAFFAANAYLMSREYFELAAGRFRPLSEAAAMRRHHRGTILAAGAVLAALMLVPIVNLVTPLFGIALMVHLHKGLTRRALVDSRAGRETRAEVARAAR
jgi:CysZ protein